MNIKDVPRGGRNTTWGGGIHHQTSCQLHHKCLLKPSSNGAPKGPQMKSLEANNNNALCGNNEFGMNFENLEL
jgi:hypothetical protein